MTILVASVTAFVTASVTASVTLPPRLPCVLRVKESPCRERTPPMHVSTASINGSSPSMHFSSASIIGTTMAAPRNKGRGNVLEV
eukprot:693430-Rhodomonas_salina.2